MIEYKEFKFIIQPIFLKVEDDEIIGEAEGETIVLYGINKLMEFIGEFQIKLQSLNEQENRALLQTEELSAHTD
jgi:hypothetical protein